jgi:hypothetical protein
VGEHAAQLAAQVGVAGGLALDKRRSLIERQLARRYEQRFEATPPIFG